MSLSGLRKQFNKANQVGVRLSALKLTTLFSTLAKRWALLRRLSLTMSTTKWRGYALESVDMHMTANFQKVDLTYELINALIASTHEYLQPNPGETLPVIQTKLNLHLTTRQPDCFSNSR